MSDPAKRPDADAADAAETPRVDAAAPDLRAFFTGIGAYYQDPSPAAAEAWVARHPGWRPAPQRLAVYGRHARLGVTKTLGLLFDGCRDALGDDWVALADAYYATRPGTHFEINQVGAGFPAFVAARADALPPFLPQLAAFEWTIFSAYKTAAELPAAVEALTVNPTLATHEHGWRLCPFLAGARDAPPAAEAELALTWRHPQTLRTRYATATPRALLALKLVLEAIPRERAAAEGGVGVAEVQAALDDAVARGLLLAPAG